MVEVPSDDEVARQILGIFLSRRVHAGGRLRRNDFIGVRDAYFQRGLNKAVQNNWVKLLRDRYTYELTEAGFAGASPLKDSPSIPKRGGSVRSR
jgi:hypothetical protein